MLFGSSACLGFGGGFAFGRIAQLGLGSQMFLKLGTCICFGSSTCLGGFTCALFSNCGCFGSSACFGLAIGAQFGSLAALHLSSQAFLGIAPCPFLGLKFGMQFAGRA
jgi:hypothetical protein